VFYRLKCLRYIRSAETIELDIDILNP